MGPSRRTPGGGPPLTRIAQIVPNLATFAVDDGFSYRVPDTLGGVEIGSLVRVPLGGRRVRGFVTHVREGDAPPKLRDVLSVIGDVPVFQPRLLETLRWASIHYVAPVAALLAKTVPPNVARRFEVQALDLGMLESPLPAVSRAAAERRYLRPQYLIDGGPWSPRLAGLASDVLRAGRNVAIVAPTVTEAHLLASGLGGALGITPWLATSREPAKNVTKAWVATATGGGQLLIGTREVAFWPLGDLGLMVVLEEGRPAMKAPQTPTTSVRDVVRRRAAAERFVLVFAGPVPTVEAIAAGAELHIGPGRVWPLVELADRAEEPPGSGTVLEAARRAISGALARNEKIFVFSPRRGEAAAFRCVACQELRRCEECGAAVTRGDVCQRCGSELGGCASCGGERFQALGAAVGRVVAELRRSFGDRVGRVGEGRPVTVGTERDLPEVGRVGLTVVVDADGMVLAPHYRAEEDALRTLARVALRVGRGRGRRCLIQTSQPSHRVFQALRHGRPSELMAELLVEREAGGFPPIGELLAVEITDPPAAADQELRDATIGATVRGPAPAGDASRWLVAGADLRPLKLRLRELVQRWRDAGARVRVDADPVRL